MRITSPTSDLTPSCSKTFLARLCEQAERYDEMVTYMKEVANVGPKQPPINASVIPSDRITAGWRTHGR
jgi:hypothetical protein